VTPFATRDASDKNGATRFGERLASSYLLPPVGGIAWFNTDSLKCHYRNAATDATDLGGMEDSVALNPRL
jgi:hypothetical protein